MSFLSTARGHHRGITSRKHRLVFRRINFCVVVGCSSLLLTYFFRITLPTSHSSSLSIRENLKRPNRYCNCREARTRPHCPQCTPKTLPPGLDRWQGNGRGKMQERTNASSISVRSPASKKLVTLRFTPIRSRRRRSLSNPREKPRHWNAFRKLCTPGQPAFPVPFAKPLLASFRAALQSTWAAE